MIAVEIGSFASIVYWLSNLNEGDNGGRFGYFIYMLFLVYWVRTSICLDILKRLV